MFIQLIVFDVTFSHPSSMLISFPIEHNLPACGVGLDWVALVSILSRTFFVSSNPTKRNWEQSVWDFALKSALCTRMAYVFIQVKPHFSGLLCIANCCQFDYSFLIVFVVDSVSTFNSISMFASDPTEHKLQAYESKMLN